MYDRNSMNTSTNYWNFLYRIAADIPKSPGSKTVRTYFEFFKSLAIVLPNKEERTAYKKIVGSGPFKLTSSVFSDGPEKAVEWVVDVHNGILMTLGKQPNEDARELWKLLKYTRSERNALNMGLENDENLELKTISSTSQLTNHTNSERLTIVMFDTPHFLLLIPRPDKRAGMDVAQIKARFGVESVVVPGYLSFRWFFAKPFTSGWKFRVTKFPWFRLYKNGKIIAESKDVDDIKRYLKQRAMRNAPITYTSHNNNRKKTPISKVPGIGASIAHGLAEGAGRTLGHEASKAYVPKIPFVFPWKPM